MARFVAVPLRLETGSFGKRPLGLVDELRLAVERIKRTHPSLANSKLQDVALKRRGDHLQVTLYFIP